MPRCDMIDTSHLNDSLDFHALKASGVIALCQKSSQGSHFIDPTFKTNMARASEVGWLRLAYHFVDGSPAADQFANIEAAISGVGKIYICLDVEFNPNGAQPTAEIVNELITLIVGKYGRHPILYGSNVLQEMIGYLSTLCPLWIANYNQQPTWGGPVRFLLWQWSESGDNAQGVPEGVDCSQWMDNNQTFADWYAARAFAA